MVNVVVPKYPTARGRASLTCNYELGNDKLYSVKWYRDGSEFYRYLVLLILLCFKTALPPAPVILMCTYPWNRCKL